MIIPARITKDDADRFVYEKHRTHDPDQGYRFCIGAWDSERDILCGVAVVGTPRARAIAVIGTVVEVTRCCTDRTREACSWLYAKAADHARIDGWASIITYTLSKEGGRSLLAAGWWWDVVGQSASSSWANRDERDDDHVRADRRWLKLLNYDFRAAPPPVIESKQLALRPFVGEGEG